ncbi:molybdopterin-dependent oxidoreductase [Nocardia uniformis]
MSNDESGVAEHSDGQPLPTHDDNSVGSGLLLPSVIAHRISPARGPAVAARVGIMLGAAVTICFLTGLLSHWIQHPPTWFVWPVYPVWLYRVTQGAHVISGVVAIPLLLVKLWSVYPRLYARPLFGNPLRALERGSIALLVGSVIFQLVTGLFNTAQNYPWRFFFTTSHYAMAYVAAGALAIHLAVKLPVVREALAQPLVSHGLPESDSGERPANSVADMADSPGSSADMADPAAGSPGSAGGSPNPVAGTGGVSEDFVSAARGLAKPGESPVRPTPRARTGPRSAPQIPQSPAAGGISRRVVLGTAAFGAAVAALAVAGQTVPFLRWLAVLAPRSGEGPQGVPINRTAAEAGVTERATAPDYALTVVLGDRRRTFTRADLTALPQHDAVLPIACVEGWSASARWSGIRLRDLLAAVGEYRGGELRFTSLEDSGIYRTSVLPRPHAIAADTLVALRLNGSDLNIDHGYPCRLIAPNRPGVLQTKWLATIEELI